MRPCGQTSLSVFAAPLARHRRRVSINSSGISGNVPNVSNLADRRSFEVPENAMSRQQNRAVEQSHPSQRAQTVPYRAFKFTKSPSAQGRLAFADVVINEDTFHLFNGLKVCSFVILKSKGYGQPRRVYVPGHKLPSGQNFRHVQQDSRDLDELQQAILTAYEERYGNADRANADAHQEENLDEERVDEAEMPF